MLELQILLAKLLLLPVADNRAQRGSTMKVLLFCGTSNPRTVLASSHDLKYVCCEQLGSIILAQSWQTLFVGIVWTRNIRKYQIISQNLKNSKLISFYENIPFTFECFMTYNTASGAKKHCESTEQESRQTARMFFRVLPSEMQEQQISKKGGKQGRDDNIKLFSIQPHLTYLLKMLICYPYILLHLVLSSYLVWLLWPYPANIIITIPWPSLYKGIPHSLIMITNAIVVQMCHF